MQTSMLLLARLLALSAAATAEDYRLPPAAQPVLGSPGTATPQPFTQPTLRNLPSSAPNVPPLLRRGPADTGSRLNSSHGNLALPDADLPLLEEQRQRNSQRLGDDRRRAD